MIVNLINYKTRKKVHEMGKATYSAKFKADRVLEVLLGEEQLGAIAAKHGISPNLLRNWKKEFLEKSSMVFDESRREKELADKERRMEAEREELLKTVGQLTIERDWLKKNQSKCLDPTTRKGLVKSRSDLTVERQCDVFCKIEM